MNSHYRQKIKIRITDKVLSLFNAILNPIGPVTKGADCGKTMGWQVHHPVFGLLVLFTHFYPFIPALTLW